MGVESCQIARFMHACSCFRYHHVFSSCSHLSIFHQPPHPSSFLSGVTLAVDLSGHRLDPDSLPGPLFDRRDSHLHQQRGAGAAVPHRRPHLLLALRHRRVCGPDCVHRPWGRRGLAVGNPLRRRRLCARAQLPAPVCDRAAFAGTPVPSPPALCYDRELHVHGMLGSVGCDASHASAS